jgi:outer membrane protein
LEHNIDIKQSGMASDNSEMQWKQAKYNRLPSVSAGLSDGFSFGRSLMSDNTYANQNANSADASLSASVSLFEGMRVTNDIAARKLDFMAAVEDQQRIKNDVSLTIASLFLNVLVQKELLKIAENQKLLTDTLVARCEVMVNTGKEPISKLYELKAQQANDAFSITTAEKNLRLALLDLAQILEVENFSTFDVVTPELLTDVSEMPIPTVIFDNAAVTLPNVKAEEFRLERSKKGLEIAKSSYYPSVSLGASTSTNYYYMSGNTLPNEAFGTQLSNNWRSYVGLSVSIPIFSRMATRTSVSQSKLQIQNQEFEVEKAKKTLYKDIQRAMLNAKVSKDRYMASVNSVQANEESYRYAEQRYEAGRSTFFDMQQSKTGLEKALSEQIQAKYEFIFNTKVLDFYNGNTIEL